MNTGGGKERDERRGDDEVDMRERVEEVGGDLSVM